MDSTVIAAIIGAIAVIVAAVIGVIAARRREQGPIKPTSSPQRQTGPPDEDKAVVEAYNRMSRVLGQLGRTPEGVPTIDGTPVPDVDSHYVTFYDNYLAIIEYVRDYPGDIKGAYEKVWNYGGRGRTFTTNDTQHFEAVVSEFVIQYERAAGTLP
jgi:hypothetical protein